MSEALSDSPMSEEFFDCPVCMSICESRIFAKCQLPCHHLICLDCAIKLESTRCPICRNPFSRDLSLHGKFVEMMRQIAEDHVKQLVEEQETLRDSIILLDEFLQQPTTPPSRRRTRTRRGQRRRNVDDE